jgi:3-oxoadipate enol-lactonase
VKLGDIHACNRGRIMAMVRSGAVDIHYDLYKNGERTWIVFVHGAGGNAASWWQQVPYFYERFNIVTFDHRAFGRSRCPVEEFGVEHFASDLRAVIDAAGIERAVLVCQSMGGRTGLKFALESPERATALVMSHTIGGLTTDAIVAAREALDRPDPSRPFGSWAVALDYPEINVARSHLYNCITALNVDFEKIGRARLSSDANNPIGPEDLEGFEVPTLFITADKDMVVAPRAVEIGASLVPGASLVNLGEAGHSSYFEMAGAFNGAVENFLDEVL